MSNYIPKTLWGWLGVILLAFAIMRHRMLGWLGWIITLAAFWWLYVVKDQQTA